MGDGNQCRRGDSARCRRLAVSFSQMTLLIPRPSQREVGAGYGELSSSSGGRCFFGRWLLRQCMFSVGFGTIHDTKLTLTSVISCLLTLHVYLLASSSGPLLFCF